MHLRGMGVRRLFVKPDIQMGGAAEGLGWWFSWGNAMARL